MSASFLGVVMTRLEILSRTNIKSILLGRSHCDICNHTLRRWQLTPLLGFLSQSGKCYDCHTKIPLWMTLYELSSGLLRAYIYRVSGDIYTTLYVGSVGSILIGLLRYDVKKLELHLGLFFLLLGIIGGNLLYTGGRTDIRPWMISVGGGFLFIYALGRWIAYRKSGKRQEGMGIGDVMMSVPIGVLLGQIVGSAQRLDVIRWTNIYMLASAVSMLIYMGLCRLTKKKTDIYMPFLVGMVLGLYICYVLTVTSRVS